MSSSPRAQQRHDAIERTPSEDLTFKNPMHSEDDGPEAEDEAPSPTALDTETYAAAENKDGELIHRLTNQAPSCGCFSVNSKFRQGVHGFVHSAIVRYAVLVLIVANVVLLMLQGPVHTLGEGFDEFVFWFDWTVSIIFTLEMVLKMMSDGIIMDDDDTYLRDPWNVLDFFIIMSLWVSHLIVYMFPSSPAIKSEAMRTFRAIRPLRSLRVCHGLHGLMKAMWSAAPYLIIVFEMLAFFLAVFGLMGVQMFGGAFSRTCSTDPPFKDHMRSHLILGNVTNITQSHCPMLFDCDGLCDVVPFPYMEANHGQRAYSPGVQLYGYNRYLENKFAGFDNIFTGTLTLFIVASLDEWPVIVEDLADSNAKTSSIAWGFMAGCVIFLGLLTINLFTAVVSYGFQKLRDEENISAFSGKDISETIAEGVKQDLLESSKLTLLEYQEQKPFPFVAGLSSNCFVMINHWWFDLFIISMVLLNALAMATEYHGMSQSHVDGLFYAELVFLIIFTLEILAKWLGMGMKPYFDDSLNVFDFMLVLFSYIGMLFKSMAGTSSGRVLRIVFRLVKVARVFRLVGKSSMLSQLLKTVFGSWETIWNLCVFMVFSLTIYAVIGLHTFGYTCHAAGGTDGGIPPRVNFRSFTESLLTCFQVMSGEDWAPILFYYMHHTNYPLFTAFFFVSCFTINNCVLVSLFVAVILENFQIAEEQKKALQAEEFRRGLEKVETELLDKERYENETTAERMKRMREAPTQTFCTRCAERMKQPLFMSPFRTACKKIVENPWFERGILFVIIMSSAVLALESPPQVQLTVEEAERATLINVLGVVFLVIFVVEMILKIIALGFLLNKDSYLGNSWNVLDFVVVIFGLIDLLVLLVDGSASGTMRVLRLLRVLRPLRLVKHNKNMVVVVNALIACMPTVTGVIMLVFLLFFVFGIIAMNMFSGLLFTCSAPPDLPDPLIFFNASATPYIEYGKAECLAVGAVWSNAGGYSFDNIFQALKTLFVVTTLEGWVDIMHACIDATAIDSAPVAFNNLGVAFFFVVFVVFGAFFAAQLFIGVLVAFFNQSSGMALLTVEQKQWVQISLITIHTDTHYLVCPTNPLRANVFSLVVHPLFDKAVVTMISLNVVVLCAEHFPMDEELLAVLEVLNFIFLIIFTIEACLKMVGLGPRSYLGDNNWNRLDFVVVIGSWLGFIFDGVSLFQAGRAIRVIRVLLLVKHTESLKTIFSTLVLSIPPAANITMLLMLFVFISGIIGMQLFAAVPHGLGGSSVAVINDHHHFDDIQNSMKVLLEIATGADWFLSYVVTLEGELDQTTWGTASAVYPYFMLYYVFSVFVFMNLFIAVLLENFEMSFDADGLLINPTDIEAFRGRWIEQEKERGPSEDEPGGYMKLHRVKDFVKSLEGPFAKCLEQDERYWFNTLLSALGYDPQDQVHEWDHEAQSTEGIMNDTIEFHQLLRALALLYLTVDSLPINERVEMANTMRARAEYTATRLIAAVFAAKKKIREMPANYPESRRKARIGAILACRDMMVSQICKLNKVTDNHSDWDANLHALIDLRRQANEDDVTDIWASGDYEDADDDDGNQDNE